jgi:hypothetical protein
MLLVQILLMHILEIFHPEEVFRPTRDLLLRVAEDE